MKFDKNFILFSVSFSLIFFTFAGAQQYLTVEFDKILNANIAFTSLFLIYLFAAIFSPLSAYIVSKFNPKKGMIVSSIIYLIFCWTIITKNEEMIYAVSLLLGIASSILWTSNGTYIISITDKNYYGRALGIFNTVFSFMCISGIVVLGILLTYIPFEISYTIILIPGIAGFFMLFFIKNLKISKRIDFKEGLESFHNIKLLMFFPLYLAQGFLFSLTIGFIPIEIKNILPEIFIGIFGMLFYLIPLFFAYHVGKISDHVGRRILFIIFYILISFSMLIMLNKEMFILGLIIFAIAFSFTRVLLIAYVGDLCKGKNLESGNALFNTALNSGVVIGFLTLMIIGNTDSIYIISLFIVLFSLTGFVVERKFKM